MKITISPTGITAGFDLADCKKELKKFLPKIKQYWKNAIPRKYSIALVDDRYTITGYIIQWGIIKISLKKLKRILKQHCKTTVNAFSLTDIFNKKFFSYLSDELTGYENDTPNTFDIHIEI